jgi:DNA-binding transcriptional regulator YbjK
MSFEDTIKEMEEAARKASGKKRAEDGVEECAKVSEKHFKKVLRMIPEEDRHVFLQGMATYMIHISKNIYQLHKDAEEEGWDLIKLSTIEQLAMAGECKAMTRIKKWMMKQGY